MKTLYLDYNATTPAALPVYQAMEPFFKEHYGNASSLHHAAREPRRTMRDARRALASLLGTQEEASIIFTSGGTESNNAVLRTAVKTGKRRIVTTSIEHSSILRPAALLEQEGIQIYRLRVNRAGQIDLNELREALTPETALLSLMTANNETGIVLPFEEAGRLAKERGILFHVDAVQSIGKQVIQTGKSSMDYLSLSAHKFYGPKGIGALYVRPGVPFEPLIAGGSQERGRRGGTENVPGIAGLGKACELIAHDMEAEIERLREMRNEFETRLCAENEGVEIAGKSQERLPNTTLALFSGVDAEAMLYALDAEGIACSSGSACMSGAKDPSHVLTAMGYERDQAMSAVRFSFGRFTRQEELSQAASIIQRVLSRLRKHPDKTAAES